MKSDEFLTLFQSALQREEPLSYDMDLDDIEEWDSLAALSLCVLLDNEFGKKIVFSDLAEVKTVEDIAKIAGI